MRFVLTTDQKGSIAEWAIVRAAAELGIGISRPLTDGERYDLVFDIGSRLIRVQCKWATISRGALLVRCRSSRRARSGHRHRCYSAEEIDGIAAYSHELDRCFFVPIEVVAGRAEVWLRLEPTRNGQAAGVTWADDFDLGRLHFDQKGP